uniref:Uncharacterized protein n=1 Tax=Anguilla anguilla TaxID=7936 RepID=A0A0E9QMM8_ANGAN
MGLACNGIFGDFGLPVSYISSCACFFLSLPSKLSNFQCVETIYLQSLPGRCTTVPKVLYVLIIDVIV